MGKTRSAGWIGGTAVLIVAILVATYFLLYSPRADEAAATLALAGETNDRNDILETEVAGLAQKAGHIEVYTDALNEIATQIPDRADLAQFTEMVRTGAGQFSVLIEELSPGVATAVTLPTPIAAAPTTPPPATEGDEGSGTAVDQAEGTADAAEGAADNRDDAGTADETAAPAAPTAPEQVEGFIAVPVTIKLLGTYPNMMSFVDYLQNRPGRLFLASNVDAIRQRTTPAAQGKPAIADGDLEVTIQGYFYVLLDTTGLADLLAQLEAEASGEEPSEEPSEEPTEPPMPNSPNNPFVPLIPSDQAAG